jgi:hypothetical protein
MDQAADDCIGVENVINYPCLKVIQTTQAIERYSDAKEVTVEEVRSLRKKYGSKVSTRK